MMEWERLCRVCLEVVEQGNTVSLFDTDEQGELLAHKYHQTTGLKVTEGEPLPSSICLVCVDKLMQAYQFKKQCVASFDTMKECLEEYQTSEVEPVTTKNEVITIKQENGSYIQYEIPADDNAEVKWLSGPTNFSRKRRGRPRKYPDERGVIIPSAYTKKDSQSVASAMLKLKDEPVESHQDADHDPGSPLDDGAMADYTTDPDYIPKEGHDDSDGGGVLGLAINPKDGSVIQIMKSDPDKNRHKKLILRDAIKQENDSDKDEDMILKQSMLANNEGLPEGFVLDSKDKKRYQKKKYNYDKIHTCDQCGSSFRSNASLQAHIRRHLGIKPYVCNVCGYACVLNMELRRHMMRHTGVRPYKCRICDRYFGDFGSRQKHERLHLGERPYQCNLCGKNFTYSYVLTNHMLTHTGEKKFSCGPCNKKFTKAHHLKYHNKVHHKDLYAQMQLAQENKRASHINISELTTVCTEQLLGMTQELNMEQGNIEIQETHVPLDDQEEMMDQKHVGHEEQVLLVNEEHSDIEMIKEESDGQVIEDYQQDDSNQMQVSKEQEILLHS